MIAESKPDEKDIMAQVVVNLINGIIDKKCKVKKGFNRLKPFAVAAPLDMETSNQIIKRLSLIYRLRNAIRLL